MLTQSDTIITSVGRAQKSVDVELGGLLIVEEDTRVVIELDDDDGVLDTVVEGVFVAVTTNPAEVGFFGKTHGLLEFEFAGGGGQVEEVFVDDLGDEVALFGGHLAHGDAFVGDDAVVSVGAAEVALVVAVPAALGHGGIFHELVGLGLGLQVWGQRLHELEAQGLLPGQDAGSLVWTCVDLVGFCAGEPG